MEGMDDMTQFQVTEHTYSEVSTMVPTGYNESQVVSERGHCSSFGDPLTMIIIGGIGMSVVSLIGIFGNIMSAIVLSRPAMRNSTNIILFGLCMCDLVVVSVALLMYGIPLSIEYFCVESLESFYFTTLSPIRFIYFDPVLFVGELGSAYFTVCVTLERFFVVYRPLMARPNCTNKNAVRVSLTIATFAILFNLPRWFEYSIESVYDESGAWTHYELLPSLRKNKNYVLYYRTWLIMFVNNIIPIFVLSLLNICIYLKIRQANKWREMMTQVQTSDNSIAKMLILIVSIFLVVNIFDAYYFLTIFPSTLEWTAEFDVVGLFLFNVNSSVNFIIYCCMAKKFRLVFLELFCPKKLRGRGRGNGGEERTSSVQTTSSIASTQI